MKIPKQVTIGEKKYQVHQKYIVDIFNSSVHGNINYSDGVLKIKKIKDERATEDTFFHEIAHGILKEMEFNYPKLVVLRNDEKFTQELGLILRNTFNQLLETQKINQ